MTACVGGPAASRPKPRIPNPNPESRVPSPDPDAIFLALGHTIRSRSLPVALFEDLLSAFRQDVVTTRYETWADVIDYCRRSANPVGRLVLRVAGHADERLDRASDAVCTALQLTNFWQDLERDWRKGRVYVPRDERERFGAREADLDARMVPRPGGRRSRRWRPARAGCSPKGAPSATAWAAAFVRVGLTWLGGRRILDRLERGGFDVFTQGRLSAPPTSRPWCGERSPGEARGR